MYVLYFYCIKYLLPLAISGVSLSRDTITCACIKFAPQLLVWSSNIRLPRHNEETCIHQGTMVDESVSKLVGTCSASNNHVISILWAGAPVSPCVAWSSQGRLFHMRNILSDSESNTVLGTALRRR